MGHSNLLVARGCVVEHRFGRVADMRDKLGFVHIGAPLAIPTRNGQSTRGESRSMSERRRLFELIVLWASAFILSKAVFSYIFDRPWPPTVGNLPWELTLAISYIVVALILIPWYRETLF